MCGIIGVVGRPSTTSTIIDCLRRLEYRGYDSAGIATLDKDGSIQRRRAQGKLVNLEELILKKPLPGNIGIGHTRWATHGTPTTENAHPHCSKDVALVHNGIIENFAQLRENLQKKGHEFESDTDTEVIVHLITDQLKQGKAPAEAVRKTLKNLDGAFAFAMIFANHDNLMIGARRGSPLTIGYGDGETYLGSDALSLAHLTQRITYLEEGDWVEILGDKITIYNEHDQEVARDIDQSSYTGALVGKGNYRHFMQKEIYEQPTVFGNTLQAFLNTASHTVTLPDEIDFSNTSKISIIACGTSYYAGCVAKYWIEKIARVPVEVDIASEFRYRQPPLQKNGVAVFISQSGETADTLAALRYCNENDQHTIAVVNVAESSIAREVDTVLQTLAGPEIGVASTKAFTVQLMVLAAFAISVAKGRGQLSEGQEKKLVHSLIEVPARMSDILGRAKDFEKIAHQIFTAQDVLYLGRSTSYPIAMEGALKLKEISYIHAEGYAAGELKHGPIALIDEGVPVIAIAPYDSSFEKTISNVQEVLARGGDVILLTDKKGQDAFGDVEGVTVVCIPTVDAFVSPILYALPIQLLAYHTAILKGTDVDQPRNLAKSVTVE